MAKRKHRTVANGAARKPKDKPRAAAFFDRGINSDTDFTGMSLALCGDLIHGRLSAAVGNAVCSSARNVLKVIELRHRYGRVITPGKEKTLELGSKSQG